MEPEQVRNIMDSMIRKLYSMELEERNQGDGLDEEMRGEIKAILEKNKAFIRSEKEWGRSGDDLAFAIAELGEEVGFVRGFKCAFRLFMECRGK